MVSVTTIILAVLATLVLVPVLTILFYVVKTLLFRYKLNNMSHEEAVDALIYETYMFQKQASELYIDENGNLKDNPVFPKDWLAKVQYAESQFSGAVEAAKRAIKLTEEQLAQISEIQNNFVKIKNAIK